MNIALGTSIRVVRVVLKARFERAIRARRRQLDLIPGRISSRKGRMEGRGWLRAGRESCRIHFISAAVSTRFSLRGTMGRGRLSRLRRAPRARYKIPRPILFYHDIVIGANYRVNRPRDVRVDITLDMQ